jgi:hypothetical protein
MAAPCAPQPTAAIISYLQFEVFGLYLSLAQDACEPYLGDDSYIAGSCPTPWCMKLNLGEVAIS